jgi:spore maturation protein SpmA
MLNWIWLAFLLVAVLVGGFNGKLPEMTTGAFDTAKDAVMTLALPLVGLMAIWLGIMRLAERSGLVQLIARALRPLLRILFPEVPADHPAMGAMVMNMAANMLGLGNAATPLGLRAMNLLERLNPRPGTATNAMCTFLAINTASIQLIPTTAIAILAVNHSRDPTSIVLPAFLATCIAATSGVCAAKLLERLPIFQLKPVPGPDHPPIGDAASSPGKEAPASTHLESDVEKIEVPPLTAVHKLLLTLFVGAFAFFFLKLTWPHLLHQPLPVDEIAPKLAVDALPEALGRSLFTGVATTPALVYALAEPPVKGPILLALLAISKLAVPFLLSFFPLYAAMRQVKVYEQFVEGAKEAFNVALRIIPFLVAMLVAMRLLRDAGVVALVTEQLSPVLNWLRFPPDLLPMVLMRPLSGSGTLSLFTELVQHLGADNIVSRMAATIFGSTETTFYVIAVYFGSVAVRQSRHAVLAGLTADTVAVIASITLCRLFFS